MNNKHLVHYASPYYDPVKAHEYYMRTRELKGRMSTAKLNDEGRKVADYVKKQLNDERSQKVQSHSNLTNNQIESLRDQKTENVENHKQQMQTKIDGLKDKLSNMSKQQKAANKERIMSEINILREENRNERVRLQNEFKASSASLRSDHKIERTRLKEEYDGKIADEMDKIRSEAKYQKVAKSKSKSNTSGGDKLAKYRIK